MATIPKAEVEVAINTKMGKSLSMKIIRWLWIILICCLFIMVIMSVYILPETMDRLMLAVPFLTGLIFLVASIGFGGAAIKRHELLKNGLLKNGKI